MIGPDKYGFTWGWAHQKIVAVHRSTRTEDLQCKIEEGAWLSIDKNSPGAKAAVPGATVSALLRTPDGMWLGQSFAALTIGELLVYDHREEYGLTSNQSQQTLPLLHRMPI